MSVNASLDTAQNQPSITATRSAPVGGNKDLTTPIGSTSTPKQDINAEEVEPKSPPQEESTRSSHSSLLVSLLSPFSAWLQSSMQAPTPEQSQDPSDPEQFLNQNSNQYSTRSGSESGLGQAQVFKDRNASNRDPRSNTKAAPTKPTPADKEIINHDHGHQQQQPEAYYTPAEVPMLKALQKKRLTGTRIKQLIRAASRAHDEPPPPPELGLCCGSACDPCVNDLWREERDVWRERWRDRAVEGSGMERKDLEW
ncbi:uncharacterized protein N7459_003860 [Penicillium hispanicum]|uniref:uncharacterized protein n=1 Tax=Penicillium hispanicum TaxID=1080232 RepID=UPI0025407FB6|nr:uncharacterized protein N7459_003860 [Penicillium hispanicum]KAJ5584060.1 hypothetical protein N7459_003860 [Penicillium hispanicum]